MPIPTGKWRFAGMTESRSKARWLRANQEHFQVQEIMADPDDPDVTICELKGKPPGGTDKSYKKYVSEKADMITQHTGMTADHIHVYAKFAVANDTVVLQRNVNLRSQELLADKEHVEGKPMSMKGKSSAGRMGETTYDPTCGFIPRDQNLSKIDIRNRTKIKKFQAKVEHALGNKTVMAIHLKDKNKAGQERTWYKLELGDNKYDFVYRLKGGKNYYCADSKKPKSRVLKHYDLKGIKPIPLEVIGSPHTGKMYTADYDPLVLAGNVDGLGHKVSLTYLADKIYDEAYRLMERGVDCNSEEALKVKKKLKELLDENRDQLTPNRVAELEKLTGDLENTFYDLEMAREMERCLQPDYEGNIFAKDRDRYLTSKKLDKLKQHVDNILYSDHPSGERLETVDFNEMSVLLIHISEAHENLSRIVQYNSITRQLNKIGKSDSHLRDQLNQMKTRIEQDNPDLSDKSVNQYLKYIKSNMTKIKDIRPKLNKMMSTEDMEDFDSLLNFMNDPPLLKEPLKLHPLDMEDMKQFGKAGLSAIEKRFKKIRDIAKESNLTEMPNNFYKGKGADRAMRKAQVTELRQLGDYLTAAINSDNLGSSESSRLRKRVNILSGQVEEVYLLQKFLGDLDEVDAKIEALNSNNDADEIKKLKKQRRTLIIKAHIPTADFNRDHVVQDLGPKLLKLTQRIQRMDEICTENEGTDSYFDTIHQKMSQGIMGQAEADKFHKLFKAMPNHITQTELTDREVFNTKGFLTLEQDAIATALSDESEKASWHGADTSNPVSYREELYADLKSGITVFLPNGDVNLIRSLHNPKAAEVKLVECINKLRNEGYAVIPNPRWGWETDSFGDIIIPPESSRIDFQAMEHDIEDLESEYDKIKKKLSPASRDSYTDALDQLSQRERVRIDELEAEIENAKEIYKLTLKIKTCEFRQHPKLIKTGLKSDNILEDLIESRVQEEEYLDVDTGPDTEKSYLVRGYNQYQNLLKLQRLMKGYKKRFRADVDPQSTTSELEVALKKERNLLIKYEKNFTIWSRKRAIECQNLLKKIKKPKASGGKVRQTRGARH